MKKGRIHASVDEIAKSLHGNWRPEHLFALKQALNAFDFMGTQLTECDQEIRAAGHAMRQNSICARSCSRCAAST